MSMPPLDVLDGATGSGEDPGAPLATNLSAVSSPGVAARVATTALVRAYVAQLRAARLARAFASPALGVALVCAVVVATTALRAPRPKAEAAVHALRAAATDEPSASAAQTALDALDTPQRREPVATAVESPGFLGQAEHDVIERLRSEALVAVRKGRGGRTLAFKVTLASGIKGYFKPEQSVSSAHWYAEVATYHLDRALGMGRVPPVTSRRFAWNTLVAAAGNDRRIPEVSVGADGQVRGALVAWLDEPLLPAKTPPGWENWIRAEPYPRSAVSPYQRPSVLGAALNRAHQRRVTNLPPELHYDSAPEIPQAELPAALSDMLILDFLTLNYDRFGGDNVNVLTRGPGGPLIFLDNGDGFSSGPVRRHLCDERLEPLSRFRWRTIEALRAFDIHAFEARLAREPLAPILDAATLAGLAARRTIVLEHVAAQQRRYGDVIYAW